MLWKVFSQDSFIGNFLSKVYDLMMLNLITLLGCLPIITIGTSITAAHYVALRLRRRESEGIFKDYFTAFKKNFLQSTGIWILLLLVLGIAVVDFLLFENIEIVFEQVLRIVITMLMLIFAFACVWVFPLQARFYNPIRQTIKNAFAFGTGKCHYSLAMLLVYALPVIFVFFSEMGFVFFMLYGLSLPIYFSAVLYDKVFRDFEMQNKGHEECESNS